MNLNIELANEFTLKFAIIDSPVANLWLERMSSWVGQTDPFYSRYP